MHIFLESHCIFQISILYTIMPLINIYYWDIPFWDNLQILNNN